MKNTFKAFFFIEIKRAVSVINLSVMIGFFLLSMALIWSGIRQYDELLENRDKFQEAERLKVEQFQNYEQYGGYGIRLYFMPSPLCIFFHNSDLFTGLMCRIDVGEKLNIYTQFKGKQIFGLKSEKWLDFSGIFLLFGSFMAIFWGFNGFHRKEYLKFLSSFCSHEKIFYSMILSRVIIMCLYFLIVFIACTSMAILWLDLKNICLNVNEILHLWIFALTMLLLLLFFYFVGVIIATLKYKLKTRDVILVIVWFIFVYLFPVLFNVITNFKSQSIPGYDQIEVEKLKSLMKFEENVQREVDELRQKGKFTREAAQEIANRYGKTIGKEIEKVENDLQALTMSNVNFIQFITAFSPSSFYLSINNEISSRGYENAVDFHRYAVDIKKKFLAFYTQRRFSGKKPESFIRDGEDKNIYKSESILTWAFWLGFPIMIFYVFGTFSLSYHCYEKNVFRLLKEDRKEWNDVDVQLNKGESNALLTTGKITVSNHIYNVLSGKTRDFKGKVILNGKNIADEDYKRDFTYLCQPDQIPGEIKTTQLLTFIRHLLKLSNVKMIRVKKGLRLNEIGKTPFDKLHEKDRGYILLAAAHLKKSDIYLFHDFAKGMPGDFIEKFKDELKILKERDAAILYITNDIFQGRKLGDYISTHRKEADLMAVNL